ncbi:Uncharacterized membrane protein [Chitinophaga terrae (ex Kim and Jung 2007)]|uniref:Uncharacterized membrane protein n=1 Tax=Chitinophaga terrae (ex Kim and Jung 2007) TaxID=408074 RepID=A0A1H4GFM5_9BACT|nr:hypothetical protein [Chitinophaga terrae (ex Kim and Jung 2007)]GEP93407.1 hypothetical protein CTE07_50520 [Chitinophaga terrae (ex Kim and Jung 2007)]SEB08389.1 Uncharacterized membrane protein [Chitinophaga terrae (ex Kim and Jung 2007)]
MKPLIVLLSITLLAIVVYLVLGKDPDYMHAGRIGMGSMLLFTALGHFLYKKGMTQMMPAAIPYKEFWVVATGIIEILAAIALFFSLATTLTGWLLILFFICLLPANINAAINRIDYQRPEGIGPGVSYLWFRIPLQVLFIVWVYWTCIWA